MRGAGVRADYPLKAAAFGKQFKQADALGARFAVIVGEDEISRGALKVKDLKTGEEREVALAGVVQAVSL